MMDILQFEYVESVIYRTMTYPDHVPEEGSYASNALIVGEPYHGVYYTSLQLSGTDLTRRTYRYGGGMLLPQLMTTYWPGGAHGVLPESTITLDLTDAAYAGDTDELNEDYLRAREIQRQVHGLELTDRTLTRGRYREDMEARGAVDYNALDISRRQSVPLGAIAISRVIQYNQLRVGEFAAKLYFPVGTTYPLFILRSMKAALPYKHQNLTEV